MIAVKSVLTGLILLLALPSIAQQVTNNKEKIELGKGRVLFKELLMTGSTVYSVGNKDSTGVSFKSEADERAIMGRIKDFLEASETTDKINTIREYVLKKIRKKNATLLTNNPGKLTIMLDISRVGTIDRCAMFIRNGIVPELGEKQIYNILSKIKGRFVFGNYHEFAPSPQYDYYQNGGCTFSFPVG